MKNLKTAVAQPMDGKRVHCKIEEIDKSFDELEKLFKQGLIPLAFFINFDEAGYCEWEDATPVCVIVPQYAQENQVFIPVDRASRRSSLLAAIAADGTSLPPSIIVKRKSNETELFEYGHTPDKFLLFQQENGFVTAKIFLEWATNILIPFVNARRQELNYDGDALFIMNGLLLLC